MAGDIRIPCDIWLCELHYAEWLEHEFAVNNCKEEDSDAPKDRLASAQPNPDHVSNLVHALLPVEPCSYANWGENVRNRGLRLSR
jgi:hypothetical protein